MDFSFSSQYRLKTSQDFDYLRRDSKRFNSFHFIIYFKKSRLNFEHSRLGISVSKVSGNAIARNKFKRHIREAFRLSPLKLKGLDLIVVVSKKNVSKKFHLDSESMNKFRVSIIDAFSKIA